MYKFIYYIRNGGIMVEYSSLSEEERIYIENCFILDLNKEENLNKCIEVIDNFLLNYKEDFLENLKYKPVVEILLKRISESNQISKKTIEEIAKKYNEEHNKSLIIKEEKIKKGLFSWIIKIFRGIVQKEINIDTTVYDNEEIKLVNEFNVIAEKINTYINEVNKLNNIINESIFKSIMNKAIIGEKINEDLIQLIDKLKQYRIYIASMKSNINEELITEIIVKSEEEKIEEIAEKSRENIILKDTVIDENVEKDYEKVDKTNEIITEDISILNEENDNSIYDNLFIEDIFNDNIFKIFVNYCSENNIKTISQLEDFDFNELDKLKGFGVGKKEKLINKYSEVIGENCIKKIKKENTSNRVIENRVKDIYKNLDIAVLECFTKISGKVIEQIKDGNIRTIDELYTAIIRNNFSIPKLGDAKIKYIKEAFDNFEKEPVELVRLLIDEIKENPDYEILIKRSIENKTLQQIGEEEGVSRERIRQREKKIVNNITALLKIIIGIVQNNESKLLRLEEILEVAQFTDEEKYCLKYVLINLDNSNYTYIEELDKFLINGDINEIKSKVSSISNGMPDIVSIKNELIYDLEEYSELNILSLDDVVKILVAKGYKKVNDYLVRGTVSKTKIYNFIVKEFFREGITFSNDVDIDRFISILNENFDIQDESVRNIKAKIETSCVLCDRGSYIHQEWIYIDERLLDKIKEYIDNNDHETLYINQVFTEFESELNNVGIKNRYYLQGILKYYFSDKYNFTKDTLYKGNIKHDRNYIFNKYIKEKGRAVTKEDIANDLKGWTPIMLTTAEDECKYVLKWDKGGFIHASLIKVEVEEIKQISDTLLMAFDEDKESITDNELFHILSLKFERFLDENNIDSSFKLFSVLEYLLSKVYYFKRPYILKNKPKEAISAVYLMKKLFNNNSVVTLDQLKEFCNNIKLNDSTRMSSINKLLNDVVEIEKETYILKENFEVDETAVEVVKKIILVKLNQNGYVALKSIDDYSCFPNINYKWNTYILRSICECYIPEVKELKKQFYDKRYSVPVIVNVDSEMNELLDLIIKVLKNEFNGKVEMNELSQYLRKGNLIHDKIPFEIYNSDEIIVEDNIIRLK